MYGHPVGTVSNWGQTLSVTLQKTLEIEWKLYAGDQVSAFAVRTFWLIAFTKNQNFFCFLKGHEQPRVEQFWKVGLDNMTVCWFYVRYQQQYCVFTFLDFEQLLKFCLLLAIWFHKSSLFQFYYLLEIFDRSDRNTFLVASSAFWSGLRRHYFLQYNIFVVPRRRFNISIVAPIRPSQLQAFSSLTKTGESRSNKNYWQNSTCLLFLNNHTTLFLTFWLYIFTLM